MSQTTPKTPPEKMRDRVHLMIRLYILLTVVLGTCAIIKWTQNVNAEKAAKEKEEMDKRIADSLFLFTDFSQPSGTHGSDSAATTGGKGSDTDGKGTTTGTQTAAPAAKTSAQTDTYHEGYAAGYDDGEGDATSGSPKYSQHDDQHTPYTGRKATRYRQGYTDGYEDGWGDNR